MAEGSARLQPADEATPTLPLPAALLGGMSDREFFASWWRRRFLHRPGAAVHLLPIMPTRREVEALLDAPGHEEADLVRFLTFPTSGQPVTRTWLVSQRPPQRRHPAEAVNLLTADRSFPALTSLAAGLSTRFSAPVNLQLFWAPAGGGVGPHRDLNDSFVIQLVGKKRWRFADPAEGRPQHAGNAGGHLAGDATVVELEPGDVLYKPSHGVHATESGDEPTLSLTCSIVTRTAIDVLLAGLRIRLAGDSAWNERFPLVDGVDGSDDDEARARLADALDKLAGRLPQLADLERLARP